MMFFIHKPCIIFLWINYLKINLIHQKYIMAKFLKSVLMLAVIVFAYGCSEGGDSDAPAAKRTVLVYIAANNDLSGYAQMNMNDMVYGAADCNLQSDNLIVNVSTPNENPCL